jgi:predicted RNA-binding protein
MKHLKSRVVGPAGLTLLAFVSFGLLYVSMNPPEAAAEDIVYRVAVKMEKVERTPVLAEEKEIKSGQLWGDDLIDTAWYGRESGFNVTITNKKDEELIVTWQKSWIIDQLGKKRVIIAPSRIAGKTKNTKSSTIPAKGKLRITVMPEDYIKDQGPALSIEGNMPMSGKSSWRFPVFKQTYTEKEIIKTTKKQKKKYKKEYGEEFDFLSYIDKSTVEVVLNMDINNTPYVYHFYFQPYIFDK